MHSYWKAGAAAAALVLAACGSEGGDGARDGAANESASADNGAGNAGAASLCFFEPGDVRNFTATVNGMPGPGAEGPRPLVVRGEVRIGREYRPRLFQPEVQGDTLRLLLTPAERNGPAATDDWQAIDPPYEHADGSGISKVAIWCDRETQLTEIEVVRPQ